MERTWTDVTDIPALRDEQAWRLAAAEYRRMADVLHGLQPDDWSHATACAAWDVRALVAHVVGATEQYTAVRKGLANQVRAQLRARRRGEPLVDAWTGSQVDRNVQRPPAELVSRFDALHEAAVRGRRTFPRVMARSSLDDGFGNTFPLGELMRVVATRDCWMHRDDLAQATGRPMALTADHDGVLVADVVAEWARRHGQGFRLELTGEAGGRYAAGAEGPVIELDAVAFCRTVSGRTPGEGLLAQQVPF